MVASTNGSRRSRISGAEQIASERWFVSAAGGSLGVNRSSGKLIIPVPFQRLSTWRYPCQLHTGRSGGLIPHEPAVSCSSRGLSVESPLYHWHPFRELRKFCGRRFLEEVFVSSHALDEDRPCQDSYPLLGQSQGPESKLFRQFKGRVGDDPIHR